MRYVESKYLELKEQLTNTFLKTVCAYSNQNGGDIIFGIKDNGKIVGLNKLDDCCDKIERKIIDSISPMPFFSLEIDHKHNTVKLIIEKGTDAPYFYKSKSYIRQGKSTIEADKAFLKKLILESKNIQYEELDAISDNYQYSYFENKLKENLKIEKFNNDIAVTLGIKNLDGIYNNAGALIADTNNFYVIDTVKFDKDTKQFSYRKSFDKRSVLKATDQVIELFNDLYSYEKIDGKTRTKHYKIPKEAFREALINAVVHRDWEIDSPIKVTFYDDSLEILSPGSLPKELNKDTFLNQQISVPRNLIICSIFKRLGYIEKLGYGISIIKNAYRDKLQKPEFEIMDQFIKITLPATDNELNINHNEQIILRCLKYSKALSSTEIAKLTDFSKTKVVSLCNKLVQNNLLRKIGSGRGTKYKLN